MAFDPSNQVLLSQNWADYVEYEAHQQHEQPQVPPENQAQAHGQHQAQQPALFHQYVDQGNVDAQPAEMDPMVERQLLLAHINNLEIVNSDLLNKVNALAQAYQEAMRANAHLTGKNLQLQHEKNQLQDNCQFIGLELLKISADNKKGSASNP